MSKHGGAPEAPSRLEQGIAMPSTASKDLQKRYNALTGPVQTFRLSGDPCTVCGAVKACDRTCSRGTRARMVPVEP